MAFVVSSGSLDTGAPVLGALTGLTQGLQHGLIARRQQDISQGHLQLAQADQALRQRAYQHGLQSEAEQEQFFQSLGKLSALGPDQPSAPSQQQVGPDDSLTPQAGAQLPPQMQSWLSQAQDIASKIKSPKAYEAFQNEVHLHLAQQAIQQHQQRITSDLQNGILKGNFNTLGPGGTEDLTQTEAAKAILQEVQNADPQNPQEAAALLDHADQSIGALRVHVAQHNTEMLLRQKTGEKLLGQMEQSFGAGHSIDDATAVYHLWQSGVLDDKGLEKVWPDAIAGTLTLKNQNLALKAALEQATIGNMAARTGAIETPTQKLGREVTVAGVKGKVASTLQGQREQSASNLEDKRQQGRLVIKGMGDQASSERTQGWLGQDTATKALVAAQADPRFAKAKTPAERQAIVDEYAQSLSTTAGRNGSLVLPAGSPASSALTGKLGASGAGTGDSASSILEDFKGSKIDKAAAIKRAQALGFKSFEELQAAAGKK